MLSTLRSPISAGITSPSTGIGRQPIQFGSTRSNTRGGTGMGRARSGTRDTVDSFGSATEEYGGVLDVRGDLDGREKKSSVLVGEV